MTMKLVSALILAAGLWLGSLSAGGPQWRAAQATAPVAIADPASGPLNQTFVFYLLGFQANTRLTLAALLPGTTEYRVLETEPVFSDANGQAVVPVNVASLVSADPNQAHLLPFLGLLNVVWSQVDGGVTHFMVAACDTAACAELAGTVTFN